MKVLAITNMYPTSATPRAGTFVEQQVDGLRREGVAVEVLHLDRAGRGVLQYGTTWSRLREELDRVRPDVVHVMCGGVMGWQVSRAPCPCALVIAFCGTDLLGDRTGPPLLRMRAAVGVWCSRASVRRADHVVVKSAQMMAHVPRHYPKTQVSIIPNGVDLTRFRPMDRVACRQGLGWRSGCLHVVIAAHGPGDRNKRIPLAAAAVRLLADRGLDAELHLMAKTPHPEVPVWLNAADVVVMTSHHEGSPNIVKEALACNRPVVSVDAGDVRERLEGIRGCFIADANAADIADKLVAVHAGPGQVEARDAMAQLSVERVAERLVGIYETAIARSSTQR
ncbi:MAG: glycosyltransferase [Candidatus Eisenbacteria bacterium]|nr:glycosyltransferase [Candidatus Eisenbacteria bacterium]